MKTENGIITFEANDKLPDLPEGLIDNLPVISKFGFKIVYIEDVPYWEAATEFDFRNAEGTRLGIPPDDVVINPSCVQTGPRTCSGNCARTGLLCNLRYDPNGRYYYCGCDL